MIQYDLIPMVYLNQRTEKAAEQLFFMAPEFNDLPLQERETVLDQLQDYLQSLRPEVVQEKQSKDS